MKIPVFVSRPTKLNADQKAACELITSELEALDLEPRTVGQSDFAVDFPLREVLVLSRHCAGGIVLGFSQLAVTEGISKPGTGDEGRVQNIEVASPWNQIEAGILYALNIPLLVFREPHITGGIFDLGTGDYFLQRMPDGHQAPSPELRGVLLRWQSRVRDRYYGS